MVVFECAACGTALTVPLTLIDRSDHEQCHIANGWMPSLVPPGTCSIGPERILVAPGDVRGSSWIDGRLSGCCCGLDGHGGPNLACACGHPVAARVDDCSFWQMVWLDRAAVRAAGELDPVAPWDAFDWQSVPLTDGRQRLPRS